MVISEASISIIDPVNGNISVKVDGGEVRVDQSGNVMWMSRRAAQELARDLPELLKERA